MAADTYNPRNIHAVLSRIEEKLDYLIAQRSIHAQEIAELKKAKWISVGVAIGAGVLGSAAANVLK